MSWPVFVGAISAIFVFLNLIFGSLFALLPNAVTHLEPYSLVDGFFFSVETLSTVGYGTMAPASVLGHAVAAVESLLGLFFSATMTGMTFARFARPTESLTFGRFAVIGRHQGQPALMVRIASTRDRPLSHVTAQVTLLEQPSLAEGRHLPRLTELGLLRSCNPMLGLAWTLVHVIDDQSPVLRAFEGPSNLVVIVTVSCVDTLLANQSYASHNYMRGDVLLDHAFSDVLAERDGVIEYDAARMHDVSPLP